MGVSARLGDDQGIKETLLRILAATLAVVNPKPTTSD
jgi:hypothetical protein